MAKTKRTDLSSALKPAPFQQARRTIPAGAIGTQAIEQLGVPSVSPVAADFSQSNQFQQLANLLNATGQLASGLERRNRGKLERQRRDDNELKGEALQDARNMLPTLREDLLKGDPRWDYDPSKPPNEEAARLLRENLITDKTPEVYSDQILNSLVPSISTKIIEIENAKLAKANQESDSRNSYAAAEPGQDLAPIFTAYVQRHAEAGNDKNFFNFYTDVLEPRIARLSHEGETEKLEDLKARIKAAPKGGDDFDYGAVLDPHITRSEQAARVAKDQIDKENVEEVYVRMQAWKEAGKNILFFPLNDHLDDLDIPLYRRIAIGNDYKSRQSAHIKDTVLNSLAMPEDASEFKEQAAYWKNMHVQGHIDGGQLSLARKEIQDRNSRWIGAELNKVAEAQAAFFKDVLNLASPKDIPPMITEYRKSMGENKSFQNAMPDPLDQNKYFEDIEALVDKQWGEKLINEELGRAVDFLHDGNNTGDIGTWLSGSSILAPNADGTTYTAVSPVTGKAIATYSHSGLMNILYSQTAAKLDADFAETYKLSQSAGAGAGAAIAGEPPSYEATLDHVGEKMKVAANLNVSMPGLRNLVSSISGLDPMSQIPEDKEALVAKSNRLKDYYIAANTVDPSGRIWAEQVKRLDDQRFKYIDIGFDFLEAPLAIQNILQWPPDFNPSVPPKGLSGNRALKRTNNLWLKDVAGKDVNDAEVADDLLRSLYAYMNIMPNATWEQGRDGAEKLFNNQYERGLDGRWQARSQQSPEMIHIARSALTATIEKSDPNEYNYDSENEGPLTLVPGEDNPNYIHVFKSNGMQLTKNDVAVTLDPAFFKETNANFRKAVIKDASGALTNREHVQNVVKEAALYLPLDVFSKASRSWPGRTIAGMKERFDQAVQKSLDDPYPEPDTDVSYLKRVVTHAGVGPQLNTFPFLGSQWEGHTRQGRLYSIGKKMQQGLIEDIISWLNAKHVPSDRVSGFDPDAINALTVTGNTGQGARDAAMILGEDY